DLRRLRIVLRIRNGRTLRVLLVPPGKDAAPVVLVVGPPIDDIAKLLQLTSREDCLKPFLMDPKPPLNAMVKLMGKVRLRSVPPHLNPTVQRVAPLDRGRTILRIQ